MSAVAEHRPEAAEPRLAAAVEDVPVDEVAAVAVVEVDGRVAVPARRADLAPEVVA